MKSIERYYSGMEIFQQLNKAGMTIIQVTHSEENAQYGKCIVRLVDGAVVSDKAVIMEVTDQ